MKKKLIIILTPVLIILLIGIILLVLKACDNNSNEENPDIDYGYDYNQQQQEDPFTTTDLVKNGESDYVIVIPANNKSKYVNLAAGELVNLIYEATGIELEIVTDDDIDNVSEASKYLSIGKTKVYEASKITATFEELGADGLKLYTYGNSVDRKSTRLNSSHDT